LLAGLLTYFLGSVKASQLDHRTIACTEKPISLNKNHRMNAQIYSVKASQLDHRSYLGRNTIFLSIKPSQFVARSSSHFQVGNGAYPRLKHVGRPFLPFFFKTRNPLSSVKASQLYEQKSQFPLTKTIAPSLFASSPVGRARLTLPRTALFTPKYDWPSFQVMSSGGSARLALIYELISSGAGH